MKQTADLSRRVNMHICKADNYPQTFDFTILPQAQCFLDLRPGGGLCHILGTAYKFKAEQGW